MKATTTLDVITSKEGVMYLQFLAYILFSSRSVSGLKQLIIMNVLICIYMWNIPTKNVQNNNAINAKTEKYVIIE